MRTKILIGIVIILMVSLGLYLIKTSDTKPYIIKAGIYPMTVQFISDKPGNLNVRLLNDTLFAEGTSVSLDSSGYIYLKGHIENVVPDSFIYEGSIRMFASKNCCGLIERQGRWTFRRIEKRDFFRLKERDELCSCDTCCIYLDIHIKPKI